MDPVLLIAAAIGIGAAVRWSFAKRQRALRRLRWSPRVALGELSEGQIARVVGTVRMPGETIYAPLSGRPCVAFDVSVAGRLDGSRLVGTPSVRISEQGGVPFAIEDGTGRALVDPTNAEIVLDYDANQIVKDTNARVLAFCERHSVVLRRGGLLRYREGVIAVGDKVAVVGTAARELDPKGPPHRGDSPAVVRLSGSPALPLVISDNADTTR